MSLPKERFLLDGKKWGYAYVWIFERAGDAYPDHSHPTEAETHITIPLFGRIRLTGDPRFAGRIIEPQQGGLILRWKVGEVHGFVAETDGAALLHVKNE